MRPRALLSRRLRLAPRRADACRRCDRATLTESAPDAEYADADPTASSLIGFLKSQGAGEMRHAAGRSLLDHLVETSAIVGRWEQPGWLAHAALLHSVYGTDRYREQLLPLSTRTQLRELADDKAERIAYLFSTVPRGPLLAGTYRWAPLPENDDLAP